MLKLSAAGWWRLALVVVVALSGTLIYVQANRAAAERESATRHLPLADPAQGFVSSKPCRACHAQPYESWHDSYHRTMTQPVSQETVRGDFSGVTLVHGAERVQLSHQGDHYSMDVLPPMAAEQSATQSQPMAALAQGRFPVKLVTGSHHMQVYWYESGNGRALGQVPFVYLFEDQRWVPRHMVFMRPPGLFRAGELGRWNASCTHCHSTRAEPRLAQNGEHDTRVTELGIACEACHGPGDAHVQQMSSPLARYSHHLSESNELGIINPAKLNAARASVICSQCHASWQPQREQAHARDQTGLAYRPGDDPLQTMWLFELSRVRQDPRVLAAMRQDREYGAGQFWRDGQARVSGREYNGMIESACMQSGKLSCLSCHDMHRNPGDARGPKQWADDQLAPDKTNEAGDAACSSCHESIAKDLTQHTHHGVSSAGSRCYNCHMPHTSWGLLKSMRSHRITIPTVQETLATGRPNACTLCHLDRSLRWTAEALQQRWGIDAPPDEDLAAPEHVLAAGVSLALLGDAGQRGIVAAAMRRPEVQRAAGTTWMAPVLGVLLDDPYDAVRYVAGHALQSLPGFEHYAYDFVPRPAERPALADDVARRAAPAIVRARQARQLSAALPFTSEGLLAPDATRELLSRRDQSPVHLLE